MVRNWSGTSTADEYGCRVMNEKTQKNFTFLLMVMSTITLLIMVGCRNTPSHFAGPVSFAQPLPQSLLTEFDKYVQTIIKRYHVPGLSMVLVHNDQVVYHQAFGVRDLQSSEPVNSQTLFGIGSSTKPMTAVMIASLVDQGTLAWDTPVTKILPAFTLSDPEVTANLNIEETLCMCTGVPRRMEQISVQYEELTPEDILESLADIRLSGTYRRSFNYSSRMLAAGGYLAAIAIGGAYGDLSQVYRTLMQEKIFDPLGMSSSTFSITQAVNSGNSATPYYCSLSGCNAISPQIEGIFTPIAPAGAMWSNTDDLAKFLAMVLSDGISEDGEIITSPENLAYLWKKRVAVDPSTGYGLGWYIEDYHGLTVYHHPGGTVGFASELVVIPELQLGFALLTNQLDQVSPIGRMATYRLLELLAEQEQVYDREIRTYARRIRWQTIQLSLLTRKKVKSDQIAPFLGTYHNQALGEIEIRLHQDNTLWVDFGEYESSIRPLILEKDHFIFYESVFIGKTLSMETDDNGSPRISWRGDEDSYIFIRQ